MNDRKLKIAFAGTPEIAIPILDTLNSDENFSVEAVITQEDKPVGRKKEITAPAIKIAAEILKLPVLQPPKLRNNKDFYELLKNLNLDFLIVIAYGHLIPKKILELPKYGCINLHASLLPKYRGASPIQNALLNGDKETGITIMKMGEKMDEGDIYYVQKIGIDENENYSTLSIKIAGVGSIMLPPVLIDIKNQILTPIPQNDSNATHCEKIIKKDGFVDLKKETAKNINNKYRAFYEWPGIYTTFNEKSLKLIDIEIFKGDLSNDIFINNFGNFNNELFALTKDGILKLNKVQPEGKKEMDDKAFINGYLH